MEGHRIHTIVKTLLTIRAATSTPKRYDSQNSSASSRFKKLQPTIMSVIIKQYAIFENLG
jgi:hypothetical protein